MSESESATGESVGEAFDEVLVRAQLASGDLAEVEQGLAEIDRALARHVMSFLRRGFPGVPSEDLADAWQETLTQTFQKASSGEFDGEKPLMPFLCTVARRRVIDFLRKRTSGDNVVQAIGEDLRETQVGAEWRALEPLMRNEVLDQVRGFVLTLPPKQRTVFQVFADGYPDTRDMEVLRVRVGEVTGRPETLASVKRALQEGRDKVREFLDRNGVAPPPARKRP